MSADGVILGPEAKIDFNGVPFGTVSGRIQIKRDKVQRTDTETLVDEFSGTRAKLSKLRTATLNITAHRADDQEYHVAPTADFQSPDGVTVSIWPHGRDDADGAYEFPALLFEDFSTDWNVQGSAVQSLTYQGEADGDFFLPGE